MRYATQDNEPGCIARKLLGNKLRALVGNGLIEAAENAVERVGRSTTYWAEALESLGHFLEYDASGKADHETVCRVEELIATLQPRNLEARVRFLVTEMPWDFPCGEKLDFDLRDERQVDAVRDLAREIAQRPEALEEVLPAICCGQQRMASVFGKSVAGFVDSPAEWLEKIVCAVIETPGDERDFDLLSGFLFGIADTHPDIVEGLKQRAVVSRDLAPALPLICWRLGISASDIELVISALEAGFLEPRRLAQWTGGGVLAKVPAPAVAPLFDVLLDLDAEAYSTGIELIGMYVHGASARLEDLRPQIRTLAQNLTRWKLSAREARAAHHFQNIMNWMLAKGRNDDDARATASTLADAMVSNLEWNNERIVEPVIPLLLSDFPEIVWQLIGPAVITDKRKALRFRFILKERVLSERLEQSPILNLPEDTLFAWCRANPEAAPAFAAEVLPFLSNYRPDAPSREIHPRMRRLLQEFGDNEDVLFAVSRNIGSFFWSGSLTTYHALFWKPLEGLKNHSKRQVRRWASAMLQQTKRSYVAAKLEDEECKAQGEN